MFTLKIETDNAAFSDGGEDGRNAEVARILKKAARQLEDGRDSGACIDANGNKVGEWEVTGDDEAPAKKAPPAKWHGDRMD